MNQVTCPDCQAPVPPYATACPECGCPLRPAAPRMAEHPAPPFTERPAPPFAERPAPEYGSGTGYGAPCYGASAGSGYGAQGYGPSAGSAYGAPQPYPAAGYGPADPYAAQKSAVTMVYALYAAGFLFGPLGLVAVVMAYIRRGEVRGSWMAAHYDWVIDTFWLGLVGGFVGVLAGIVMMLLFVPMGVLLLGAMILFAFGWPIYRLVVGWTALENRRLPIGRISPPRW